MPPHAALRMIESIIRLSTVRNETGALEGEEKGRRGDWDEGIDEDEDRPQPPPNMERERPDYNKLNWNGPSARKNMGGNGGGGGMPSRPLLGGR